MGVELVRNRATREPAHEEGLAVTMKCLGKGLSLNIVRHGMCCVLRLAPPLTISQEELDQGLDRLEEALAEVFGPSSLTSTGSL